VWALAGALPVAAVAPFWSAYYFLFALAGLGLALGAAVSRARRPVHVAVVVLALGGWASLQARALVEFATAPSAWSAQSHVNRLYLLRGMRVVERVVGSLRAMAPVEHRTTFFVAGLPSFAAIQVADGPLVRSVFRDSTLRSHYLSEITPERFARGPWRIVFYDAATGMLQDHSRDPQVLLSTALGMVLSDRLEVADATLAAATARGEPDVARDYVTGFVALARGDSARALVSLARAGFRTGRGGAAAVARAEMRIAAGDSLAGAAILREAVRNDVLEPALHARLADLLLAWPKTRADGQLEAFAARVLEPGRGLAWRRWAFVLATENRPERALEALDRYVRLDPDRAAVDTRARDLRAFLTRTLPGGDLAQRSLRRELDR